MAVIKFPYKARSAFFLTCDDLNPAIHLDYETKKYFVDAELALEKLKILGSKSREFGIPISYGLCVEYSHKCYQGEQEVGWVKANFLDGKYSQWREELKRQIEQKRASLFLHSYYHSSSLGEFKRPPYIGGYEGRTDWVEAKKIIKDYFGKDVETFRSPGYGFKCSEGWTYYKFLGILKNIGFKILLDKHFSSYTPNNFGYGYFPVSSHGINYGSIFRRGFRKIIRSLPLKLRKLISIDDYFFYIGTYPDTEFIKGDMGNAYERVKRSFENGDFIQESILFVILHYKNHYEILDNIMNFIASKGVNKPNGVWCPRDALEVKNWFDKNIL
jgi:hypothetical protein